MILEMVDKIGARCKIILHDPVHWKQIPSYIAMADCVVVPSLTEGFGFTAAESCAMGKPIVATSTTSLPEVVSGMFVLVKPRSAKSLAEGIIKIHQKRYTKKHLKKFTIQQNIKSYVKEYQRLMDEKP
jgi:glycosyltransferase involved in cell wall biosynthesis